MKDEKDFLFFYFSDSLYIIKLNFGLKRSKLLHPFHFFRAPKEELKQLVGAGGGSVSNQVRMAQVSQSEPTFQLIA